jgi:cell division protein ZapA (FtsZ GTPase activity inhibitor)
MIKKYKLWVVLTLVAVFGLGAAAGIFSERYLMHRRDRRPSQPRTPFVLLEPVVKALNLTADQQDKLRDIFKRSDERMKVLDGEIHGRLREIRTELKSEVDAILTPEQRARLEELIQKERARHQPKKPEKEPQRSGSETPPKDR